MKFSSRRTYFLFISLLTLAVAGIGLTIFRAFYVDDAYISLRFCYNLINGDGLVWNPGERVEGYTNFLLVMLVSGLGWLGVDLVVATRIVAWASYAGLFIFILRFLYRRAQDDPGAEALSIIPLMFVAGSYPLIIWTQGGLETTLFVFLSTAAIWMFVEVLEGRRGGSRTAVAIGVLFALAVMARPDGILFLGCAGLVGLVAANRPGGMRFRDLVIMGAVFAAIYSPYFLWRFNYYGDIFPNTFYTKSGFSAAKLQYGLVYVAAYLFSAPFLMAIFALEIPYALILRRWSLSKSLLAMIVLVYTAYVIRVGGDHMLVSRFIVPIIPSMALFVYLTLQPIDPSQLRLARRLVPAFVLVLALLQIWPAGPRWKAAERTDPAITIGMTVGKYIAAQWPSGSLVALNTAGSTPYFATHNRYIDMLGLVDRHIGKRKMTRKKSLTWERLPGHEKGDGLYVLSREPDYIILGGGHGTRAWKPMFVSDVEIAGREVFIDNYQREIREIDVREHPELCKLNVVKDSMLIFTFYQRRAPADSAVVSPPVPSP